jgi:hypothetical protein
MTKDQALAPLRELGVAVSELRSRTQAPDCRTCEHIYDDGVGLACDSALCTNGDQYQPAPKVVLWRTE